MDEPVFLVTGPRNFGALYRMGLQVVGVVADVIPPRSELEALWPFEVRIWRRTTGSREHLTAIVETLSSRPGQSMKTMSEPSEPWEVEQFLRAILQKSVEEMRREVMAMPSMTWRPLWSSTP